MIRNMFRRIRRFKRSEDGSLTVEFVIIFPLYAFFILSVVEYALVTIQQAMIEHSMDVVVRDIRLGTAPSVTHDDIKDAICNRTVVVRNCSQNLQLEMIVQDPYAGINLPPTPDCVDRAEEVTPVRDFQTGGSNKLMVLRACAKVDPVFPTTNMGRAVSGDDGFVQLTATTAFVQEP